MYKKILLIDDDEDEQFFFMEESMVEFYAKNNIEQPEYTFNLFFTLLCFYKSF